MWPATLIAVLESAPLITFGNDFRDCRVEAGLLSFHIAPRCINFELMIPVELSSVGSDKNTINPVCRIFFREIFKEFRPLTHNDFSIFAQCLNQAAPRGGFGFNYQLFARKLRLVPVRWRAPK